MPVDPVTAISPLSSQPPVRIRALEGDFLRKEAEAYFRQPAPAGVFIDYELWRCRETGLEFAWPPTPGTEAYYQWLGNQPAYYPKTRWEYSKVKALLDATPGLVADVGGGDGAFAGHLGDAYKSRLVIVDLSETAVRKCAERGFRALSGDINDLVEDGSLGAKTFEAVTSFHCLEHVPDPVAFGRALAKLLKPGGTLYLSTPYSPMHFESHWFDVQNHPPHHLTRWNLDAYKKLAGILNLDMSYRMPSASSWFSRSLRTFRMARHGLHTRFAKPRLLLDMTLHPRFAASVLKAQWKRARIEGYPAGDSILVMLRSR
jgi:SAM-dependent methyltransferase